MKNVFIPNKFTTNTILFKKKYLHQKISNFKNYKSLNFKNSFNYKKNLIYLNTKQYSNDKLKLCSEPNKYLTLSNDESKIYISLFVLPINFYYYNQIIYGIEIGALYKLGSLYNIGYHKNCFCYSKLSSTNYYGYGVQKRLKFTISTIVNPKFYRFSINVTCSNKLWTKKFYTNISLLKLSNLACLNKTQLINYTGRNYLTQNYWITKEISKTCELIKILLLK